MNTAHDATHSHPYENALHRRIFGPLRSRKVRVALATFLAAILANWGFDFDRELVLAIVGLGASLILGIAHEDAGRKSAHAISENASAATDEL